MALFYWLGTTGNGNVNLAANWTLWPPTTATGGSTGSGALPPAASSIPKYGDSIRFSKYTITGPTSSSIYPVLGPSGQLNGLCGPAGATALQWLMKITVDDNCPVPLGTTAVYFKVRAEFVSLNIGTNSSVGNGPQYPTYLDLISGAGATKADATITAYVKRDYTCYIKGEASKLHLQTNPSIPSAGTYVLYGLGLSDQNYGMTDVYGALNTTDKIYIDSTTTTGGGIVLNGKATKLYIAKGYSTVDGLLSVSSYSAGEGPSVYFTVEGASGATGQTEYSRSNIKLSTYSGQNSKLAPKVYVEHGVDFTRIDQNGGTIEFNQTPTDDSTIVSRGSFNASNSKIVAPYMMVNLGAAEGLYIQNAGGYTPDIVMTGVSQYIISPTSGYSGGQGY